LNRTETFNLDEKIDNLLLSYDSPPEPEIVKVFLNGFNDKLRSLSCNLDYASERGSVETMELLGSGLTILHKFAVVVRRMPVDQVNLPTSGLVSKSAKRKERFIRRLRKFWSIVSGGRQGSTAVLLGQLHQAFTAAEARAERGLREIADLHAQVIGGVYKLRDQIGLLSPPSGDGVPVDGDHAPQEQDHNHDPYQFQRARDYAV
jgi:hypothetical protein